MASARARAVQQFKDTIGYTDSAAGGEVDCYVVNPGQACSYKLGHTTFADARERARTRLGSRFDIKRWHTAVLQHGRLPLDILKQVSDGWAG